MKVSKAGKFKLAKNAKQVGNFIIKNEDLYVNIHDINSAISHRVRKHLNVGRILEMAFKSNDTNGLHNYASLVWLFSNIAPDQEFFMDINKACVNCANRHKELYNLKEDLTIEEDKEILDDAKATTEAIEELKKEDTNEDSK